MGSDRSTDIEQPASNRQLPSNGIKPDSWLFYY
jgi:hypothetical protein